MERADGEDRGSSMEEVFRAGWREFRMKRKHSVASQAVLESARRACAAYQRGDGSAGVPPAPSWPR